MAKAVKFHNLRQLFTIFLATISVVASAQSTTTLDADSSMQVTDADGYLFNYKQLIAPAALITAGALCAIDYDGGVNEKVNDWLADGKSHTSIDDYLRFLPSAGYLALGPLGVKPRHSFSDRLLVFATAHAAMLALGYGTKAFVSERRPDATDHNSMPSGHAALAFTGAELMRIEYGNWWGLGGYAAASAVAVLRLHNNAHWLSDVLVGAGIGVLSARIGYWMLPVERKWLGMSDKTNITVMPAFDIYSKSAGMSFAASF